MIAETNDGIIAVNAGNPYIPKSDRIYFVHTLPLFPDPELIQPFFLQELKRLAC